MNGSRFDALARGFAVKSDRRTLLRGLSAVAAARVGLDPRGGALAQEDVKESADIAAAYAEVMAYLAGPGYQPRYPFELSLHADGLGPYQPQGVNFPGEFTGMGVGRFARPGDGEQMLGDIVIEFHTCLGSGPAKELLSSFDGSLAALGQPRPDIAELIGGGFTAYSGVPLNSTFPIDGGDSIGAVGRVGNIVVHTTTFTGDGLDDLAVGVTKTTRVQVNKTQTTDPITGAAILPNNNPAIDVTLYRYNGIFYPSLGLDATSIEFWESFSEGAQTHWGAFSSVARADGAYLGLNQNLLDFGQGSADDTIAWFDRARKQLAESDTNTGVVRSFAPTTHPTVAAANAWKLDSVFADGFLTPSGDTAFLGGEVALQFGSKVNIITLYDFAHQYVIPDNSDLFDAAGLQYPDGAMTLDQLLECARILSGVGMYAGTIGGGAPFDPEELLNFIFGFDGVVPHPVGFGLDPEVVQKASKGLCVM